MVSGFHLRRRDAASQLDLSERQVQRLMDKFRLSGTPGLASLKRGQARPVGIEPTSSIWKAEVIAIIR